MSEIAVAVGRWVDVWAGAGEQHDWSVYSGALGEILGMASEPRLDGGDEVLVDRGGDQGVNLAAANQVLAMIDAVERRAALGSLRVSHLEARGGGGAGDHPGAEIAGVARLQSSVDPVDHADVIGVQPGAFGVFGEHRGISDEEAIGALELGGRTEQYLGTDPGRIAHAAAQQRFHAGT